MAEIANVSFFRGEKVLLTEAMTPTANIGEWEIRFRLARRHGEAPLIEKTIGDGITILNPGIGTFEIELSEEDTDLEPGSYVYETRRTDVGGVLTTGAVTVLPAVAA